MTLIKPAKANWHYLCRTCDYTSKRSPDRSGADYYGILHERTIDHTVQTISAGLEPAREAVGVFAEAFGDLADTITQGVMPVFEALAEAFRLPPNVPHDPTVRANRRAW